MNKAIRSTIGIAIILLTAACATPAKLQTQLAPGSLDGQEKIGVIWLSRCSFYDCERYIATKGNFWPQGTLGQVYHTGVVASYTGVYDAAIELDFTDMLNELYLEKMQTAIEVSGKAAVVQPEPYFPKDVKMLKKGKTVELGQLIKGNRGVESATLYPKMAAELNFDLKDIAAELGVQSVVLLQVLEFGAQRDFGPFAIPMSVTFGVGAVRGALIDAASGTTLLNDYAYYEIKPDGENVDLSKISRVMEKSNEALASAITDVTDNLVKAFK